MSPRRARDQDDDAPPPTPPRQLTRYERASVDMLSGITKMLERQAERSGKSHEEDVAERFHKQGPKEFAGTTDLLVAEEWIRSLETIFSYMGLQDADKVRCAIFMMKVLDYILPSSPLLPTPPPPRRRRQTCSDRSGEEIPSVKSSSCFLVQTDEGIGIPVMVRIMRPTQPTVEVLIYSEKLRQFTDGLRPYICHDVNMADMNTYMDTVNRAYWSERGRKDMRDDFQRKKQLQQPTKGQSSQQPMKRPFQGPHKAPQGQ
ncbi:hypothetical protein F511_41168 [Dorcoceras hygrometricum]|uniref:Uncharacterized protein n=1 Tax=Dorcoceras hygrometricum TaxID=472368 RepID=A0A2Z7B5D0_9LAMI|nr:hypothetical protein F511_41168 [Dorcoceras hygrometricum]